MRRICCSKITETVASLCADANLYLPEDVLDALKKAQEQEISSSGKDVLGQILNNTQIAAHDFTPLCQDCGTAVVFLELGQDVKITGGNLFEAVNEGVRKGYKEGYLRKSICHPLTRKNTGDNTPAVIHLDVVPSNRLKIIVCPKGGGAENMSRLKMLSPSDGIEGVKKFVVETVKESGSNPCPPVVVGVGIGGNFEKVALLAKRALLRPVGSENKNLDLCAIEKELLSQLNKLGIGPAGLGGTLTCLAVHIEMSPCHIASFPVAVNINCHSARHKEQVL